MLKKLLGITLLALISSLAIGSRAHAATVTVSGGCTISEAIDAVNAASDGNGCVADGAYGSNDTITIPSGTQTLSADLPFLQKTVVIQGAGKSATTIDGAGNSAFSANMSNVPLTQDITIKDMKITNAADYAIEIELARQVTLDNINVDDCTKGVRVNNVLTVNVSNSIVQNNTWTGSGDSTTGMSLSMQPLLSTDVPSVTVTDTQIINNSAPGSLGATGLAIGGQETTFGNNQQYSDATIVVHNVSVMHNSAGLDSGLFIISPSGPITNINYAVLVDATTVAYNTVTVPTPVTVVPGQASVPVVAGIYFSCKLTDQQNFTNVTVAYNTINNPAPDNRNTIAGFFGSNHIDSALMRITNATVVGNSVTQPSKETTFSAFTVIRADITLTQDFQVTINDVQNGSRAENTLIANNTTNGGSLNCFNSVDLTAVGFSGTLDATPVDLGHNLSDDQNCTGYTYVPNLYDTIDHEVKDNGGPVPTIALHDNSPAVNAGGQVLGISTDARGVTRSGYYSVGAYQGTILASSTTNVVTAGSQLAKTGVFIALASPVGLFLIGATLYTYLDYRKHKTPLTEASSDVNYSYFHHLKVVSLPLAKYRLSIGVDRQVGDRSDRVRRF